MKRHTEPISISKLVPYSKHPFQTYEGERLEKLADSIRNNGLNDPIIVRPHPQEEGKYEILSGHNRVEAFKLLGEGMIDAFVRTSLSDEDAERTVLDSNLNQQSFKDWKYSQQIRVIKMYSKYIQDNSQQGRRTDMEDGSTSVHGEQKSEGKPKRETQRDKFSKHLGISSPVFSRYKAIAELDEATLDVLCEALDNGRLGFMSAHRISHLKPRERLVVVDFLKERDDDSVFKLKASRVKGLCDKSKESEKDLTKGTIRELLLSEDTES